MKRTENNVNSHFIQKAKVALWEDDKKNINYIKHRFGTENIPQKFNIKSNNKKQPVAIKGFYPLDLEKGMNALESNGCRIIKNILKSSKENKIIFNRLETITLRFYLMLSVMRTQKVRNSIKNLDGDILFNKITKKELKNKSPEEIQFDKMRRLLKIYEDYKNSKEALPNLNQISSLEDGINSENMIDIKLEDYIRDSLMFVKFQGMSEKLLLTETESFIEIVDGFKHLCTFHPLTPEIGVIVVNHLVYQQKNQHSNIFDFNLLRLPVKKYISPEFQDASDKLEQIEDKTSDEYGIAYIKFMQLHKLRNRKDQYTYEFQIIKDFNVLNICNAMQLVHCDDSFVIFRSYQDYLKALHTIQKKNIVGV